MRSNKDRASWMKAYRWIAEKIDSGELKMGETLPETFLAEEIGVSRTPVREALRMLEQDGYVKIVPSKGAFVSEISMEDVHEICEIRKLLEPFAALTAAKRIPGGEIAEMSEEWELFAKAAKKKGALDSSSIADSDLKLHFTVAKYATNKRIGEILMNYHVQIKRFKHLSVQSLADIQNSIKQHLAIIECMKRRNPEELRSCLYEHIVNSEGYIIRDYFLHHGSSAQSAKDEI